MIDLVKHCFLSHFSCLNPIFFIYLCKSINKTKPRKTVRMKQKKATKILFISQEISPYLPESEIATQSRYLPQAVQERGKETRTFMPKFGGVNERRNQLHEVIRLSGMNLIIDNADHPLIIKVASIQSARLQVYFIDNDDYFNRKNTVADDNDKEYEDNDQRTIFFARGVLETVKKLRWTPDVIHCQGWFSALAPLYIKKAYNDDPFFSKSKVVYSLFDDKFTQSFAPQFPDQVLMDGVELADISAVTNKEVSYEALSKLAIDYSDGVIQSSPNASQELISYAQSKNIKFFPYTEEEDYVDSYLNFYNSL